MSEILYQASEVDYSAPQITTLYITVECGIADSGTEGFGEGEERDW